MTRFSRRRMLAGGMAGWLAMPIAGCGPSLASPSRSDLVPSDLVDALKPFAPETWPGPVGPAEQSAYKFAAEVLFEAMVARDSHRIEAAVAAARAALGKWDGVPGVLAPYGASSDAALPNDATANRLTVDAYRAFSVRAPWHDPVQRSKRPTVRLRVTARAAEAMLRLNLAGLDPGDLLLKEAVLALEFAMSVQAPTGVFGYPYIEQGGSAVARDAAQYVRRARSEGREPVHNGWIIDDANDGGLEFDNAAVSTVLLLAARMTAREDFLRAATRSGEWALQRGFVPNLNYNTLRAFLFARLYRCTGDARWLEGSKAIFEYVALPAQTDSGRWFDPHNARIQYHSIILRHGLELYLALSEAGDPLKARIAASVRRGADNLASQIVLYGSSNTEEMLSTETLVLAEATLGPSPLWQAAQRIDVNEMIDRTAARLRGRGMPVAAPMALYLQARRNRMGVIGPGAFETAPTA